MPQFDILLIDNSIPPIFRFKNADIEVVPVEAVCGIFEIKRNIDKNNIKSFIEKLTKSILNYEGLTKAAPYNGNIANRANMSIGLNVPLVGIISLTSDLDIKDLPMNDTRNLIDIIWSIDGLCTLPYTRTTKNGQTQTNLSGILARPKNDSYANITKDEWKNFINDGSEYEFFYQTLIDKKNPEIVITQTIGWLTYIFYRLCGRLGMDPSDMVNKYYLSRH